MDMECMENSNVKSTEDHEANVDEHPNVVPCAGMEFDSLHDVKEFYTLFAKKEGFGIRTHSTKTNFCILICSNEGRHTMKSGSEEECNVCMGKTKKKCSTSRTDCKASLAISKAWKRSKWVIKSFSNAQNHAMVSPKSVSYLRCHKKMSAAAKNLVEKFDEEGVPTGKVAAMFNNGDISFSNRDCWNHLRNVRRKNLDIGDAQAVFNFCKLKQAENPNFFYAIQCDDEARMINFFWVDARSRLSYKIFGDVVTFDTTYKTNKYDMSFAPFTGLNHHCQSILFGCALLQDETEKSFEWLFQTWLEAMNGKSLMSIITDQDLTMKAAIAKVFPHTRHRLCLWHIRKKIPEKLSHIYHKNSIFKRELKSCIRDSPSIKDFDEDWERIMIDYDLKENQWLQVKFDKAMDSRYEKERKEDFESRHRSRLLDIKSKIAEHATSIYTRTIFWKFHEELAKINQFTKEKIEKNGSQYTYKVSNCFDSRDTFTVSVDLDTKVANCGCQLFDFLGILCRHVLVIFQAKNIVEIPSDYILQRWTKDANKGIGLNEGGTNFSHDNNNSATLRNIHVHNQASLLSDLAAKSEKLYMLISSEMEQTYKRALIMDNEMHTENDIISLNSSCQNLASEQVSVSSELNIGDPLISRTKGRKKDAMKETQRGRIKNSLELSINRSLVKRRSCQVCGQHGHNRRSCKQKIDD